MKKFILMMIVTMMIVTMTIPAIGEISYKISDAIYPEERTAKWYFQFGFDKPYLDGRCIVRNNCMYIYDSTACISDEYANLTICELETIIRGDLIDSGMKNPKVMIYEVGNNVIETVIETETNLVELFKGLDGINEDDEIYKMDFVTWFDGNHMYVEF